MLNERSFATGSTSLSRDPSHLNVAGWRSLRRTPALPRNLRVLSPVLRPRRVCRLLVCPGSRGPEVYAGTGPACRAGWPWGPRSEDPRPGARRYGPHLWSVPQPIGLLQRCLSLASFLDRKQKREPSPLLLPRSYLGIIKSATRKRRIEGMTR